MGERIVRVDNTAADLAAFLRGSGWTDGLPVAAPTVELVAEMVAATGRPPGDVVAVLAPRSGEATVERIAANAVMAGCDPTAAPILLAAVAAVAEPSFNLPGVQATTHPCGVLVLVSGAAAARAGVQGGEGCFGPGSAANLTIGRALRLILMNIGGAQPGIGDRSCQGSPAKIAYCFTENLAASPWEAFHVAEGWPPDASTVTVVAAEGPHNIQDHFSVTANGILDTVAAAVSNVGSNNFAQALGHLNGTLGDHWRPRLTVVFGPEHAQVLAAEGLDRAELQQRLWERAWVPFERVPREWRAGLAAGTRVPATPYPEDFVILVAGGAGKHSCWIPTMGSTTPVTVAIPGD